MKIPIHKFTLADDFREEVGDIGSLAHSIQTIGLLHPIRVDSEFNVLEGRRRFRALRDFLNLSELEEGKHFVFAGKATRETALALQIQWEENIQRKDFSPKEAARLLSALHNRLKEDNEGWTQKDTAKLIGKSKGYVSKLLYMADNLDLVEDCDTIQEALDKLTKERAKGLLQTIRQQKVKKVLSAKPKESKFELYKSSLRLCDCREGIKEIEDSTVDFIYTDPPYGIDLDEALDGGLGYRVYEDRADDLFPLLKEIAKEWYRVAKEDSFIAVWTSFEHSSLLTTILANAGFRMKRVPLVWVKTNQQAKSKDKERGIGNVVEYVVYGYKGSPILKKRLTSNVLYFPTIKGKRVHVAQKPEALHKEILTTFADPGMLVLDCFAGSGSIERACIDLGMRAIGFEIDKEYYNGAISYGYEYYEANPSRPF